MAKRSTVARTKCSIQVDLYPGDRIQETVSRRPYPGDRIQETVSRRPYPGDRIQETVSRRPYPKERQSNSETDLVRVAAHSSPQLYKGLEFT